MQSTILLNYRFNHLPHDTHWILIDCNNLLVLEDLSQFRFQNSQII